MHIICTHVFKMADSISTKIRTRQEETTEQRQERLKKRMISDRRHRESETPEKRHARLDHQKAYREQRKPSETDDQRAA